jgi:hypothetical protein
MRELRPETHRGEKAFSPDERTVPVAEHTGTSALVEALRDRRRNAGALAFAVAVLAAAAFVGSPAAYFTASLVVFSTWMAWFVLTCIEWVKRADF